MGDARPEAQRKAETQVPIPVVAATWATRSADAGSQHVSLSFRAEAILRIAAAPVRKEPLSAVRFFSAVLG